MLKGTNARLNLRKLSGESLVGIALLLFLAIVLVYPVILILINSFNVSRPGEAFELSLDAWRGVLTDSRMYTSLLNTFGLVLARMAIAFPIGICISWLLARTDIPHARLLEFAFWIAFFLPTLPVVLAWVLLLDPSYGLINVWLAKLPFIEGGLFNIYSYGGIIWASLVTSQISFLVMFLTPAFRNLDASLEEASTASGANNIKTLVRVVIPLLTPTITVAAILSLLYGLQAFEIEQILGIPAKIEVYSTTIYAILGQEPPNYGFASVMSSIVLLLIFPLIFWQRKVSLKRNYTTVGSKLKLNLIPLGKWKVMCYLFVLGWALVMTIVPIFFTVMSSFMKLFGFFNIPDPWTTANWTKVLGDSIFVQSVINTLVMALGTVLVSVILFPIIAYVSVRTKFAGRAVIDYLTWIPQTVPGIILSLGLLWSILSFSLFKPIYGTLFVLILAGLLSSISIGTQMVKSGILQIGKELEEAGRITGGSWLQMYFRVLFPILWPTIATVAILTFVISTRNVSHVALLATSDMRPLALLQLDYMIEGSLGSASIVGVIVMLLTILVALLIRKFGMRID